MQFSKELTPEKLLKNLKPLFELREILNYFSITASVFKNNSFSQDSIKEKVSKIITKNSSIKYEPKDHTNLDFRINIENDNFLLSVKIFQKSLFTRRNKFKSDKGALRPTIAAAMLNLALAKMEPVSTISMVDLFCGTGTFLYEAALIKNYNFYLVGNDIDEDKVRIAKQNVGKVSTNFSITNNNAVRSGLKNNSFNLAVSNFPWGKQVKLYNKSDFFSNVLEEYSRICTKDAVFCFISKDPALIRKYLKDFRGKLQIREMEIGYLGHNPTITLAFK
ncbi:MAG: hypothetical protein Kow0081_0680 [Candidatus Dojkabacteria bacterium]